MKKLIVLYFLILNGYVYSQDLHVSFLVKDINASGGLIIDRNGDLLVSDFGRNFQDTAKTKVFRVKNKTWKVETFAENFRGASGSYLADDGVFYQSNPKGNSITAIYPDGTISDQFAKDLKIPVGITQLSNGDILVANCGENTIRKIGDNGSSEVFASSEHFACPNGMIKTPGDTVFVVNFNSDKVIKIDPKGNTSILAEGFATLQGGPKSVGLGHITYSNGFLYATAIGRGFIYKISLKGKYEIIAGDGQFANRSGKALEASFSKPNGIAASISGDSLFVNVSDPTWIQNPGGLHPAHVMVISGICDLPGVSCD